MSLDLGSLFSPGGLLFGAAGAFGASSLIDKFGKKGAPASGDADLSGKVAELQAQIDANFESQSKVDEVHAYARKLEEKVQQLESTSDSADAQLRVKVLEKQLSEKADLESRLAVALQQLEDYKAKADMFDTVVGTEPVLAAEPAPVVEAVEESPSPVAPKHDEVIAEAEEEESIAAVASAEPAPEMTVVENDTKISAMASPVGATALAVEERPALRVESNPMAEAKDPLEKIEGIGNIYQTKLYEAGIRTFAQLAAASPSRITEIVEPQNWQTIDIMKWRREAALYAAGEKS